MKMPCRGATCGRPSSVKVYIGAFVLPGRAGTGPAPTGPRGRRIFLGLVLLFLFLFFRLAPYGFGQGSGVVEGKLVNGTDPRIVGAGVEIDVIGLGGGMSV